MFTHFPWLSVSLCKSINDIETKNITMRDICSHLFNPLSLGAGAYLPGGKPRLPFVTILYHKELTMTILNTHCIHTMSKSHSAPKSVCLILKVTTFTSVFLNILFTGDVLEDYPYSPDNSATLSREDAGALLDSEDTTDIMDTEEGTSGGQTVTHASGSGLSKGF